MNQQEREEKLAEIKAELEKLSRSELEDLNIFIDMLKKEYADAQK